MLKLFSQNSVSTQVDKKETTDFSQLYENIAIVYNFFDEKFDSSGNMEDTERSLKQQFDGYKIYKNDLIQISIYSIKIENGKIKTSLKVDTKCRESIEFGHEYLEGEFSKREGGYDEHFNFIHAKFNVIDTEAEIQKRLDIINQWLVFKESGYDLFDFGPENGKKLYKKIKLEKKFRLLKPTFIDEEMLQKKKLNIFFSHLKKNLEELGNIKKIAENIFELELEKDKIEIISFGLNGSRDLYMGVENIPFDRTEELYNKVMEYIADIYTLQKEKTKLAREVKRNQKKIYTTLTRKEVSPDVIITNFKLLIGKYKQLSEKGEILHAPKVFDLLEDMVSILDKSYTTVPFTNDEVIFQETGVQRYIIENYNLILENIANESDSGLITYYDHRFRFLLAEEKGSLSEFQDLVTKLNRFSTKSCLESRMFDYIVSKLSFKLSFKHIQIIIETMGSDKISIIDNLYAGILKSNPNYSIKFDLEKYGDIFDSGKMTEKEQKVFENIIVRAISQDLLLNPTNINDISLFVEEHDLLNLLQAKQRDLFLSKYLNKLSNNYYEILVGRDKKLIGNEDIDFSLYVNINDDNLDEFIHNILIPHIVHKLHTDNTIYYREYFIDSIKGGDLADTIHQFEYGIDKITSLFNFGFKQKTYCEKTIRYRNLVKNLESLEDYTIDGLESLQEMIDNPNQETQSDLINQLMGSEKLALDFLRKPSRFPTKIGVNLAKHSSVEVRKALAISRGLDNQEAKALFCGEGEQEEEVVLAFLSNHSSFPSKIGVHLAQHSSIKVRKQIALHSNLEKAEAKALFCGEEEQEEEVVLAFLSTHSSFPTEVGVSLAKHSSVEIKKKLASHHNLEKAEAKALFSGKVEQEEEVALAFLSIYSAFPDEIGVHLAHHSSIKVKKKLLSLGGLTKVEKIALCYPEQDEEILLMLLENGNTPNLADKLMAEHPSVEVRKKLASYGDRLSKKVQNILLKDKEKAVLLSFYEAIGDHDNYRRIEST